MSLRSKSGRTSKQCRERWLHHLDPRITKKKFTAGEDEYILEAQAELGNKWSVIATRLPGRTENDIKVRWHALEKKVTSESGSRSTNQLMLDSPGPARTSAEEAPTTSTRSNEEPSSPASTASWSPSSCAFQTIDMPIELMLSEGPVAPPTTSPLSGRVSLSPSSTASGSSSSVAWDMIYGELPLFEGPVVPPTTPPRSNRVSSYSVYTASGSSYSSALGMVCEASELPFSKGPVAPAPSPRPLRLCPNPRSSQEIVFRHRQYEPRPPVGAFFHGCDSRTSGSTRTTASTTTYGNTSAHGREDFGWRKEHASLQWPPSARQPLTSVAPTECLFPNPVSDGGDTGEKVGSFDGSVAPAEASPDPLLPPHSPSSATAPSSPFTTQDQQELRLEHIDLELLKELEKEEGAPECACDGTEASTHSLAFFEGCHAPSVESHGGGRRDGHETLDALFLPGLPMTENIVADIAAW